MNNDSVAIQSPRAQFSNVNLAPARFASCDPPAKRLISFCMRSVLISLLLLLIPVVAAASDPIADLQQRIKGRQAKLEFEKDHGYLVSLLKALKVPVSS